MRFEEKTAIKELTKETQALMRDQARDGVGEDGRPYPSYSPEHAERRAKAGKSATPDLTMTGRFVRSIRRRRIRRSNGSATLFFSVPNRYFRQGIGLESAGYRWSGLSKKYRERLTRAIARARLWVSRRGAPTRRR